MKTAPCKLVQFPAYPAQPVSRPSHLPQVSKKDGATAVGREGKTLPQACVETESTTMDAPDVPKTVSHAAKSGGLWPPDGAKAVNEE